MKYSARAAVFKCFVVKNKCLPSKRSAWASRSTRSNATMPGPAEPRPSRSSPPNRRSAHDLSAPSNPVSTYYVTLAFSKILASKSLIFPGSGAIGSQLRRLLCKPAEVAQNNLAAAALALHCGAASASHRNRRGHHPPRGAARRSATREQQPPQRSASNSTAAQRQRENNA